MTYNTGNEQLNINTITFEYDTNGNRIQKTQGSTITSYTYDDENRLIQVNDGTNVIAYTYDPFGRRIEKNVNGTITQYLYDQESIVAEYDQAGNITARYTHGLNIDEPLAIEKGGQLYYYHADGLGSIVALTNSSGTKVQSYNYDSFGNITSGLPPTINQPFTYTAREFDSETGLYYYRARYYDAKAGRFLQRDPIGFDGGINQYAYVNNNPVNLIDPMGLDWIYDRGTKTLQQINSRGEVTNCWPAISGPWGKGELPPGSYTLKGSPVSVPPSHPNQSSYCDALGNCWWQPITPNFPTDRTGLGIHPDGNRPGTAGCIGATDCDTSSLRDALSNDRGPLIVR